MTRVGRIMPPQPTTVSMESAMASRETSEYFMPSLPIEMPSEMVMVLKTMALPPPKSAGNSRNAGTTSTPHPGPLPDRGGEGEAFAPFSASSASLSMCMLHGVTLLQVEAMPMMGF